MSPSDDQRCRRLATAESGGVPEVFQVAVNCRRHVANGFLAFDTNQDGFVDAREAGANPLLQQSFDAVDTDKDGRLSMEEFNKGFATR